MYKYTMDKTSLDSVTHKFHEKELDKDQTKKLVLKRMNQTEDKRVLCHYTIDYTFFAYRQGLKNIDNGLRLSASKANMKLPANMLSEPNSRCVHEKHKIYKMAPRIKTFRPALVRATQRNAGCYSYEAEKIADVPPHRCSEKCEMEHIQPTTYKAPIHRKLSTGTRAEMELPLVSFGLSEFPKSQFQVWER